MYGYPFSTSPWLDSQLDNEKIIKFDKVFSTHTHSTPSLIDALSLCISEDKQKCLGVDNLKNNLSIIELMSKAGVETNLYSTQGNLGGHNFASKLLLNTDNKFFTSNIETNSKNLNNLLGNRYKPVIKDKDFFSKYFCDNKDIFNKNMPSLSVLHSYAGHGLYGGYLGYIPKRELIKYPDYVNKQNFLGKDHKNFKLINEYDTVINYIDETLEKVVFCSLNESQQNNQPAIFVYFSDHGESPATARGHDSSRLTYEMLHVPLIILFNEKAFNIYNDKFNYLKKLSNSNLTLKSISDILIYLFDVEVIASENNKLIYSYKNFKSLLLDFIMVQKDLMGNEEKLQTFFKYDEGLSDSGIKESQFVKNDTSINLWQLNNYLETKKLTNRKNIENMVCKHRANSFITQYAASLSNGCFETDVFFVDNKVISTHELKESTDLVFSNFLDSSYQKTTVWLDSKNLSKSQNCKLANKWLSKNSPKFKSILIELPTNSSQNEKNQKWLECIKNIKSLENVQVGYYMPTNILKKCSDFKKENNNIDCNKSLSKIKNFLYIAKIQSITFDFVGYQAIKRYKIFDEFKWHVWNINNLKSFDEIIKNKNIGIVLLKNGKFSNNLN